MADTVPTEQIFEETRGFRWGEVPPAREPGLVAEAAVAAPSLGGIARFVGTFKGNGLNTIFRPQDFAVSPTKLPKPASGPNDNILEINLTEETLSFRPALGSIPNRGMVQGDAFLNGIPYVQTINDISDPAHPVGIHFEPGVWLSVPPTTVPKENATVARMASIPHGTTIDARARPSPSPAARGSTRSTSRRSRSAATRPPRASRSRARPHRTPAPSGCRRT